MKDALETIGTLLPNEVNGRDAVHMAVIAATAVKHVTPGEHVALFQGKEPVGIADPFLKETINPGQRYWLFLYPRTITSLAHHWTHPEIPSQEAFDDWVKVKERLENPSSRRWLEKFAETNGISYERLIEGAREFRDSGEFVFLRYDVEEYSGKEFWKHFCNVTGEDAAAEYGNFFTCAC